MTAVDRADTLEALALRCEAGEASRALDREIMSTRYRWGRRHIGVREDPGDRPVMTGVWIDPATDKWVTSAKDGHKFTTSLDAVSSLQEVVLPGAILDIQQGPMRCAVDVRGPSAKYIPGATATAPTEPLARLAAILRAKAAEIREGRS